LLDAGLPVDLAAVTHREDEDQEQVVLDLVDDAAIAGTVPPLAGPSK